MSTYKADSSYEVYVRPVYNGVSLLTGNIPQVKSTSHYATDEKQAKQCSHALNKAETSSCMPGTLSSFFIYRQHNDLYLWAVEYDL